MTRKLTSGANWRSLCFLLLVVATVSCSVTNKTAKRPDNSHQKEGHEVADDELTYISLNFDLLHRLMVVYADSSNSQQVQNQFQYNSIKVSVREIRCLHALVKHVLLYTPPKDYPREGAWFLVRLHVLSPYQDYERNGMAASVVKNLIVELSCADSPMTPTSRAKLINILNERYEILRLQ